MLKQFLLIGLAVMLCLMACNNGNVSKTEEGEKGDAMAKFTKDEGFKNAHDEPAKIDFKGQGEMIEFDTPDGNKASAYAIMGEEKTNKFLFVIQEWWGLNDHIKREADRLFSSLEGVSVLALDMYDGKVADNRNDAGKYMRGAKKERLEAIVNGAIALAGSDAKIATIGWCFGGGWSLRSSIMAGDQAAGCVMYYGMPVQEAKELAPLKADVLGIFAEKDGWITPEVANKFEALAKATGKKVAIHQFDAAHAFANPSSNAYNEEAAQKANALALNFLKERLQ